MKIKDFKIGEYYIDESDGEIIKIISISMYEIVKESTNAIMGKMRRNGMEFYMKDYNLFCQSVVPLPKLKRILLMGGE